MLNTAPTQEMPSRPVSLESQDKFIAKALKYLEARLQYPVNLMSDPSITKDYLRLKLAQESREVFAVMFLNTKLAILKFEIVFYGSINGITVHPRIIVQKALQYNAANIIVAHNHPSGSCQPSDSDQELTLLIKKTLALVEVNLLDHIIVSHSGTFSFSENAMME